MTETLVVVSLVIVVMAALVVKRFWKEILAFIILAGLVSIGLVIYAMTMAVTQLV